MDASGFCTIRSHEKGGGHQTLFFIFEVRGNTVSRNSRRAPVTQRLFGRRVVRARVWKSRIVRDARTRICREAIMRWMKIHQRIIRLHKYYGRDDGRCGGKGSGRRARTRWWWRGGVLKGGRRGFDVDWENVWGWKKSVAKLWCPDSLHTHDFTNFVGALENIGMYVCVCVWYSTHTIRTHSEAHK